MVATHHVPNSCANAPTFFESGHSQISADIIVLIDNMESVNIYEAKTRLSKLVDKAAAGEDVIVSRNGKPLVRINRLDGFRRRIRFGVLKGKVKVAADFDAPLPDTVLADFEAR